MHSDTPRCPHPSTPQGLTGTGCPHEQRYHGVRRPEREDEPNPYEREAYCRACDATLAPSVEKECHDCGSDNYDFSGSCFGVATRLEKARA